MKQDKIVASLTPRQGSFGLALVALGFLSVAGCGGLKETVGDDLRAFNEAGPLLPQVDRSKLNLASVLSQSPVRTGDVLDIYMPQVIETLPNVQRVSDEQAGTHRCRVEESGQIQVPLLDSLKVDGMTRSEIETKLSSLYSPKFLREKPAIVVTVREPRTDPVTVVGAVKTPGTYRLSADEMNLVGALMKAGWILQEGASAVHIRRAGADAQAEPESVLLPVKGLNIPFANVVLQPGDTLEVEALRQQVVTVVGLVKSPGVFDLKPGATYTLLQAVAMAGGLDLVADPKFATVYRQDAQGKLVHATVRVSGKTIPGGAEQVLKPGDVVMVDQTIVTSTRVIFAQIVRIGLGMNISAAGGGAGF